MPINFKNITSKEDFISYFIYYYEYTFITEESNEFNFYKEIENIVMNSKIENFKNLWIYTYLKITNILLKNYPLHYLKDTINKLIKNFNITEPAILEIQLELIKDILNDLGVLTLEIRPYEQLKLSSNYGNYLLKKENSLTQFFEENKDFFSETTINKLCYVKIKNQKYITYPTLLFELYSVILFELIEESMYEDFELNKIDNKIKEFIKGFKKGKFNNILFEDLKKKTIKYILEYKQLNNFINVE